MCLQLIVKGLESYNQEYKSINKVNVLKKDNNSVKIEFKWSVRLHKLSVSIWFLLNNESLKKRECV